mgnify:CR=1 FL=1|jgi:tryptophan synthase alpha chain
MKSRISNKLSQLKKSGQKAFVPFITAGDPNLSTTEKLIYTLEKSGASVIELGMPFSDPMADGPTIQKANERALKKGCTLKKILDLVKKVRKNSQIPILLMGYYNPVFQYGLKKFAQDCAKSGVDGLLIVDLPAEEAGPLRDAIKGKPIDIIYLITPTSDEKRLKLIKRYGSGFAYYVSFTGITGANRLNVSQVKQKLKTVRKHIKLPINIGFGISTPEHVRSLAPLADGVVVGSALIKRIEKHGTSSALFGSIEKYVKSLVKAAN